MKQIYGFATHHEMELDATLRELRERVSALEIQLAELHRDFVEQT
jgi:hypothetical protein